MKTRYLKGHWAQQYREAASQIGVDAGYYGRLTGAIIDHIQSPDFTDRLNTRHTEKVAGLLVKAVRSLPENHVSISWHDPSQIQAVKRRCLEQGPGQISALMLAFLNGIPNNVFVRPKVSGLFKAACDDLPKAQRDEMQGFVAAKFDLSDGQ
jgi:hypothetical protein